MEWLLGIVIFLAEAIKSFFEKKMSALAKSFQNKGVRIAWTIIFCAAPIIAGCIAYFAYGKNPFVYMILILLIEAFCLVGSAQNPNSEMDLR